MVASGTEQRLFNGDGSFRNYGGINACCSHFKYKTPCIVSLHLLRILNVGSSHKCSSNLSVSTKHSSLRVAAFFPLRRQEYRPRIILGNS